MKCRTPIERNADDTAGSGHPLFAISRRTRSDALSECS
ncbi:hypothetical protein T261_01393 [Streptomyces lydicus]|nr:hypothetical protein T261_01393 [Streptomyces lydicus]